MLLKFLLITLTPDYFQRSLHPTLQHLQVSLPSYLYISFKEPPQTTLLRSGCQLLSPPTLALASRRFSNFASCIYMDYQGFHRWISSFQKNFMATVKIMDLTSNSYYTTLNWNHWSLDELMRRNELGWCSTP